MLQKITVRLGNDVLSSGVSAGSRTLTDIVAGAPVKDEAYEGRSAPGEQTIATQ